MVERLLPTLEHRSREAFLSAGTMIDIPAGSALVVMGGPANEVFLLLSGYAKVRMLAPTGTEALVAVRGAGDLVGELGVLDGGERLATVDAAGPLTCRRYDRGTFLGLLGRFPDADRAVRAVVIAKLRAAAHRQVDYLSGPSRRRLVHAIVDLMREFGQPAPGGRLIPVPLTQEDWAAMTGVTSRTVGGLFAQLRDCVRTGYGNVLVTDPVRLTALLAAD
jgi:CRP/FNR family cyclic AMP-dependent transcriptional regulator